MKKVVIGITARASYTKVKTVIAELLQREHVVHVLVCASALLERYGTVVHTIRQDWPTVPMTKLWTTLEGTTYETTAIETGLLMQQAAAALAHIKPDLVMVVADRHEVLAVAAATAYLGIPLWHLQGGEQSGSIDDKVRNAITMLADVHCTATTKAAERVCQRVCQFKYTAVFRTGCPSIDLAKQALAALPVTASELGGTGSLLDPRQPFLMVLFHPVTTQSRATNIGDIQSVMTAAHYIGLPILALWPGQDAHSEAMAKVLRQEPHVHLMRGLPPSRFLRLLQQTTCLVGNSSVGIRECSYLGTPVVNVGNRQHGRECADNVRHCAPVIAEITQAIKEQQRHQYIGSSLYGTGDAGKQIATLVDEL